MPLKRFVNLLQVRLQLGELPRMGHEQGLNIKEPDFSLAVEDPNRLVAEGTGASEGLINRVAELEDQIERLQDDLAAGAAAPAEAPEADTSALDAEIAALKDDVFDQRNFADRCREIMLELGLTALRWGGNTAASLQVSLALVPGLVCAVLGYVDALGDPFDEPDGLAAQAAVRG